MNRNHTESSTSGSDRKQKNRSISLSKIVNGWAEELATKKGYDNFTAYISELIRQDKAECEQKEIERLRLIARSEEEKPRNRVTESQAEKAPNPRSKAGASN